MAGQACGVMTTVTAPSVLQLPTVGDIWGSVKMNESVAKVAIICATVLGIATIGGVMAVAILGGDVAALSLALGTVLSTAIGAWMRVKSKGGSDNGGTS